MLSPPDTKSDDKLKELLVALPFAGTAAAITFDVGYFYGIDVNFYTLFSLTEHILFALEAFPYVILVVFVLFVVGIKLAGKKLSAQDEINPSKSQSLNKPTKILTLLRWRSGLLLDIVILIATLGSLLFWPTPPVALFLLALTALRFTWGRTSALKSPRILYLAVILVVLLIVFNFGYLNAKLYAHSKAVYHQVSTKDGKLSGRIIRSGERGMLFIDAQSQKVLFLKWDEIKQLSGDLR